MTPSIAHPEPTIRESRIVDPSNRIQLIKRLLVAFAYGWWLVAILYLGVIHNETGVYLKLLSFPVVWASFALCLVFQLALSLERYAFACLFMGGLLVSGLLA